MMPPCHRKGSQMPGSMLRDPEESGISRKGVGHKRCLMKER